MNKDCVYVCVGQRGQQREAPYYTSARLIPSRPIFSTEKVFSVDEFSRNETKRMAHETNRFHARNGVSLMSGWKGAHEHLGFKSQLTFWESLDCYRANSAQRQPLTVQRSYNTTLTGLEDFSEGR